MVITVLMFPFYGPYIDRLSLLRSVQTVHNVIVRSLNNYDGNENVKKRKRTLFLKGGGRGGGGGLGTYD